METSMIRFLKKFIAALYVRGIKEIPCYGDNYEKGITALDDELIRMLPEESYENIADLFLLVPVQEKHEKFAEKLFALNGHGLSFASLRNPFWEKATIDDMKQITLQRIYSEDVPGVEITNEQYAKLAETFCMAAEM